MRPQTSSTLISVERHEWVSRRPFEEVREAVRDQLGTATLDELRPQLASAPDWDTFGALVAGAVGEAGLMLFLELDQGHALALDPANHAVRREVRFVAGNPVTMATMVRSTPGAGAFAPVTLLVFEAADGVHLRYDTLSSEVGAELADDAAPTAHALDRAVLGLLARAAGAAEVVGRAGVSRPTRPPAR
jgi:hypothetical protein